MDDYSVCHSRSYIYGRVTINANIMVLELNSTHFIFTYMVALVVKNLRASAGNVRDTGSVPGLERSLEEGMAICSSILAWRISRTEATIENHLENRVIRERHRRMT